MKPILHLSPLLYKISSLVAVEPSLQAIALNSSAILVSWEKVDDAPGSVFGYFVQYKNVMEGESKHAEWFTVTVKKTKTVRNFYRVLLKICHLG